MNKYDFTFTSFVNLPKGETLPGNLEFGTQDRTETLKAESQDARK